MKGVVFVYLTIMIVLAVFIFLYMIFSYPMVTLTSDMAIPLINATEDSDIKTDALDTIGIITTVWKYWPILLILGFVLWGLIASQRRVPQYETYG